MVKLVRDPLQSHGVIPAKAGIHLRLSAAAYGEKMDAGLRRHDVGARSDQT
jgi:hypothetical protein